jgi:hypothetical protein
MRKKSHIALAGYLVDSMKTEELSNHRKAFYLGSILPDCVPSFLTRRHSIEATFDILKNEIISLMDHYDSTRGIDTYFCRHLGIITHYIADYFTYPHNSLFLGNMKEHCIYEKFQMKELKRYVYSRAAVRQRKEFASLTSAQDVISWIESMHKKYLEAVKAVKIDCQYIVELCYSVVDAIIYFFETIQVNAKAKIIKTVAV